MILIGLTGNIATGKSYVAQVLHELGAHIIDADRVARDVVEPGTPTLVAIAQHFGPGVLQPNGALNRKALGQIVFSDKAKRLQLEEIMQPAIRAELTARLDAIPKNTVGVLEAIRLIEGGWHKRCTQTWVTHCPPETQIARLMQHRGLTEAEARARVTAQNPQADKLALADVAIDTSGTLEETQVQVVRAWEGLN
ncbi:MAG: dephospho-CoA kinase [Anaerolineae bacterium]|nr:dephospho-CoA kinase [Anaerolineae bacterium]